MSYYGNAVIGQSGNATTVINASAIGVIEGLRSCFSPDQIIYASPFGVKGALREDLLDTSFLTGTNLECIAHTPGSIFGQTRFQIKLNPQKNNPEDVEKGQAYVKRLFDVFEAHNIRYFFYNGGGDSMDTADKLDRIAKEQGRDLVVVGVPKTIDNDLFGIKYNPGYLSAAKIAISTAMALERRVAAEEKFAYVLEISGRNVGYVTVASALLKKFGVDHMLIYAPEVAFDVDRFSENLRRVMADNGKKALIIVSEGIHDKDGKTLVEIMKERQGKSVEKDTFGHVALGGVHEMIAEIAEKATGAKTRGMRLADLPNQYAFMGSQIDLNSARMIGRYAALQAVNGRIGGKMVTMDDPLDERTLGSIELGKVANQERSVPIEWIDQENGTVHLGPVEEYLRVLEPELFIPRGRVEFFRLDLGKNLVTKTLPAFKP
jgi:6-phosphofructokinase 1